MLSRGAIVGRRRHAIRRTRWQSSSTGAPTSGSRCRATRAGRCRAPSTTPASSTWSSRARSSGASATTSNGSRASAHYPVIEFDDGSVYREQSKDMAATIKAGKLDEKRGTGAETAPAGLAKLQVCGAIAQLGERLDRTQEVSGSSPLSSTRKGPGNGAFCRSGADSGIGRVAYGAGLSGRLKLRRRGYMPFPEESEILVIAVCWHQPVAGWGIDRAPCVGRAWWGC